jgi:ATP-dependent DNA helicase RecQ
MRLELAKEQNLPAFVIFHDSTLKEMVRSLPRSLKEMQQISGIGQRKLELYGERFLTLIRAYKDNPNK